eukprot:COSAG02_NODE_520_length_20751_cov_17.817112_16_plen_167_part_00
MHFKNIEHRGRRSSRNDMTQDRGRMWAVLTEHGSSQSFVYTLLGSELLRGATTDTWTIPRRHVGGLTYRTGVCRHATSRAAALLLRACRWVSCLMDVEGPSPNVYNISTEIINTVTPRAPSYSFGVHHSGTQFISEAHEAIKFGEVRTPADRPTCVASRFLTGPAL